MPAIRKHARSAGVFPAGIVMIVSGAPPSGRIRRMRFREREQMSSVSQLTLDGTSIGARASPGRRNRHALQLSIEAGYEGDRLAVRENAAPPTNVCFPIATGYHVCARHLPQYKRSPSP
jgi:hypothetical protein